MNCKFAEDENFDLCKSTFPEGATVKCLEAVRPFYKIWIYAVPCDGIWGKLTLGRGIPNYLHAIYDKINQARKRAKNAFLVFLALF